MGKQPRQEGFSVALWIKKKKKKSVWEQLFHYQESASQRGRVAALSPDPAEPQLLLQLESRQRAVLAPGEMKCQRRTFNGAGG